MLQRFLHTTVGKAYFPYLDYLLYIIKNRVQNIIVIGKDMLNVTFTRVICMVVQAMMFIICHFT